MRGAAPLVLVATAGVFLLLSEQHAVTGRWVQPTYLLNQQTYGWPLTLPWFPVKPVAHTHAAMHGYYLWEVSEHAKLSAPLANGLANGVDAVLLWSFFAGPVLTIPLLFLPRVVRKRRLRAPALMAAALLVTVGLEQSRYPHYFAPATAAFFVLLIEGARQLRLLARRRPRLLAFAALLPVVFVGSAGVRFAWGGRDGSHDNYVSWCCTKSGNVARAGIQARLSAGQQRHLIIVRYGPTHTATSEWVYNEPDIDTAKVVWARDMRPEENDELRRYFRSRKAWIVYADEVPPRLVPYDPEPPRDVAAVR
jgi:hypothetical protein